MKRCMQILAGTLLQLLGTNITNSELRRKCPSQDPENLGTMFHSLLDQGSVFWFYFALQPLADEPDFTPNKVAREWVPRPLVRTSNDTLYAYMCICGCRVG